MAFGLDLESAKATYNWALNVYTQARDSADPNADMFFQNVVQPAMTEMIAAEMVEHPEVAQPTIITPTGTTIYPEFIDKAGEYQPPTITPPVYSTYLPVTGETYDVNHPLPSIKEVRQMLDIVPPDIGEPDIREPFEIIPPTSEVMVIVRLQSGEELTLPSFHFIPEPLPGLYLSRPRFTYYDPTLNRVIFADGRSEVAKLVSPFTSQPSVPVGEPRYVSSDYPYGTEPTPDIFINTLPPISPALTAGFDFSKSWPLLALGLGLFLFSKKGKKKGR